MSKRQKEERKEAKEPATAGKTLLLVGFSPEAVSTVQAQLGRFGLTVITTGDCAGATYVAHSADDLARLYAMFRKTFTPPEPVVAEPVAATVATESAFEAAPDPVLGAWGDER